MKWVPLLLTVVLGACASVRAPGYAPEPVKFRSVEVSPQARNAMRFLYRNLSVEWGACLGGEVRDSVFVVRTVAVAEQHGNTRSGIDEMLCGEEYPGFAHSHPIVNDSRECLPSPVDNRTFWGWRDKRFMLIWCDDDAYVWVIKQGNMGNVGGHNWLPHLGKAMEKTP